MSAGLQLPTHSASEYDWRRARERMEKDNLEQMLRDRERGLPYAQHPEHKLRRMAYDKAVAACQRAMRST